MKVAYYPGCLTTTSARECDVTTRAVLRALGVELVEVPGWRCCGANIVPGVAPGKARARAVEILSAAAGAASTVLCPCAVCYNNLVRALVEQDRSSGTEESGRTGGDGGGVEVVTLAEFLSRPEPAARLSRAVTTPLEPLAVACYYGCMLSRPGETVGRRQAGTMEKVLGVLGARAVDWRGGKACCGGHTGFYRRMPAERLVRGIILAAREAGANALCVACPVCHFNLDTRQFEISLAEGRRVELPVFFLSELVAGAMELNVLDGAFRRHLTSVYRLIDEFWDASGELRTAGKERN